ncbi:MAG: response regulator transcription factor [Bacteriovoracaceae bacterium]|nr:response regulator transcription factor [Bacteriovoracaceae bacterium]
MRIHVIEDQPKMASFLKKGLEQNGFMADTSDTLASAKEFLYAHDYDLVLLDLMLPDGSGFSLIKEIRDNGYKGPIIILSALGGTKDRVHGLNIGADDFLTKPFEFDELLARINVHLRRKLDVSKNITKLKYEDLEMDLVSREVHRQDQFIELTRKEFALLEYLLRNPKKALTRVSIAENVWDIHYDNDSNVIDTYVKLLRKKVDSNFDRKLIQTVVGVGYMIK